MRLSELTPYLPAISHRLGSDPEVGGIAADSRRASPAPTPKSLVGDFHPCA